MRKVKATLVPWELGRYDASPQFDQGPRRRTPFSWSGSNPRRMCPRAIAVIFPYAATWGLAMTYEVVEETENPVEKCT